ncbi:MAG: DUF5915 domain-containing protein, partial [Dehalococcoidia bacterium]
YRREVQDIAKALQSKPAADLADVARAVQDGRTVDIAGKTLEPDELLVNGREKEGFASASDDGVVVIVSTEMTPELEQEGLAREIVHRIQNLRKDAGFEIADRIRTYYAGDGNLRDVMERFGDYVRQETLSVALEQAPPPAAAHAETANVDGREVTLGVVRA